jgi:hypothetical protein
VKQGQSNTSSVSASPTIVASSSTINNNARTRESIGRYQVDDLQELY